MLLLIMIYAPQDLSKESDIADDEYVCPLVEVYVNAVGAAEVEKRLNSWEVLKRCFLCRCFPSNISYHLSA